MAFLRDVRDYPSLIIDVRGNGRGATSSWMNYLVSPLRQDEDPVTWTYYELVRESVQDNPAARVWLDSSGVPAEAPDFPYGEAPDGFDVFRVQAGSICWSIGRSTRRQRPWLPSPRPRAGQPLLARVPGEAGLVANPYTCRCQTAGLLSSRFSL